MEMRSDGLDGHLGWDLFQLLSLLILTGIWSNHIYCSLTLSSLTFREQQHQHWRAESVPLQQIHSLQSVPSCPSLQPGREIHTRHFLSNHISQKHVHRTLLLLVKVLQISSHQITTVRFNTLLDRSGEKKNFPPGNCDALINTLHCVFVSTNCCRQQTPSTSEIFISLLEPVPKDSFKDEKCI